MSHLQAGVSNSPVCFIVFCYSVSAGDLQRIKSRAPLVYKPGPLTQALSP